MISYHLPEHKLILASSSQTRAQILRAALIDFEQAPANIDEAAIKQAGQAEGISPEHIAITLAELKGQAVSQKHDGYVLGCDQLLVLNGVIFSKPENRAEAKHHLQQLSGQCHELHTALVLFKSAERIWHHHCVSRLTMRALREDEIDVYLDLFGEQALCSPGCYQIENGGSHLFSEINGVYFDILGLPLLPLLTILRAHGLTATKKGEMAEI